MELGLGQTSGSSSGVLYAPREQLKRGNTIATPDFEKRERRESPHCAVSMPRWRVQMDKLSLTWSLADRNLRPTCAGKKIGRNSLIGRVSATALAISRKSRITLPRMSSAKCASQCYGLGMWGFELSFLQSVKNAYTLRPRIYYSYDHWDNPQQLCDSAKSGCHLCTLLWSAFSIEQQ